MPYCELQLRAYDSQRLELAITRVKELLSNTNYYLSSSIRLPKKINKITVLQSPHVYKKSREQFEIRHHKHLLTISKGSKLNDISINVDKLIKTILTQLPPSVELRVIYLN